MVKQWFQCSAKKVYGSRKKGLQFLQRAKKADLLLSDNLDVYKCPWCFKWHIGHSNR